MHLIRKCLLTLVFTALGCIAQMPFVAASAIPQTFTVTFFENATPTDQVSTFQNGNSSRQLTDFSSLNPSFSNPGYAFMNWNTKRDGGGYQYFNKATYSFSSDLTLYAQWDKIPVVHTVTFFENASPSDSVSTYQNASTATPINILTSLNPAFSNSGRTFLGWSTTQQGDSVAFSDGAVYSFAQDLSLYAVWSSPPLVTASFNLNGLSATVPPISVSQGSQISFPDASGFSRQGFTFLGWTESDSGTGVVYQAGSTLLLDANKTFFAKWLQNPQAYLVTLDANGGSVSPSSEAYLPDGPALVLPGASFDGHVFLGWFTNSSGGTFIGDTGALYRPSGDVTLFARWSNPPANYTVEFDSRGGTTPVVSSSYQVGGALVVLPTASWAGHLFVGWYDNATAGSLVGVAGQTFAPTQNTTLYAHWVEIPADRQYGYVRGFAKNSAKPSNVTKNQVMALARAVKNRHASLVTLWGFTARVGSASHSIGISRQRAAEVRALLIKDLKKIRAGTVTVHSAGQGIWPISGSRDANCVEVFFR